MSDHELHQNLIKTINSMTANLEEFIQKETRQEVRNQVIPDREDMLDTLREVEKRFKALSEAQTSLVAFILTQYEKVQQGERDGFMDEFRKQYELCSKRIG